MWMAVSVSTTYLSLTCLSGEKCKCSHYCFACLPGITSSLTVKKILITYALDLSWNKHELLPPPTMLWNQSVISRPSRCAYGTVVRTLHHFTKPTQRQQRLGPLWSSWSPKKKNPKQQIIPSLTSWRIWLTCLYANSNYCLIYSCPAKWIKFPSSSFCLVIVMYISSEGPKTLSGTRHPRSQGD